MRKPNRSIALSLLLASIVACDEPSDNASESVETRVGITPDEVRWVLDWGDVSNAQQGSELVTELVTDLVTDLGYRVRVEAGWIGSWGATLVACPEEGEERESTIELPVASPWLIAEGHSSGEDDPSAWVFAGVESLTERRVVESDPIGGLDSRYCEVHYLLAPISDSNEGFASAADALAQIDPEASLAGASLLVIGSWEPPEGGSATPFVLRSEQAYGKVLELDSTAVELEDQVIEVVLRRELATMFDQVDLASATPEDAAWQVLGNLAKQAIAQAQPV